MKMSVEKMDKFSPLATSNFRDVCIMKSEQIVEIEMPDQTDLVKLWTIHYAARGRK